MSEIEKRFFHSLTKRRDNF